MPLENNILSVSDHATLARYKKEMELELEDILAYWMRNAVDHEYGGFIGKIDHRNVRHPQAPKGSVLNSRILWAFSAAYHLTGKKEYLAIAERAYLYLIQCFIDREYGGVYWTVDFKGQPLDTKKQIYALSFAVYGLSEFYRATKIEAAKTTALALYNDILQHSYDNKHGGYREALARDWKEIADIRLSAKDANEKKSMNTHLHVLEAFANLYSVCPDEMLKRHLSELVYIFLNYIISPESGHLILFFDDAWQPRSGMVSYGHDIEAAWLLEEAAELIGNELLLLKIRNKSARLTDAASEGLDSDGGLWYEMDVAKNQLVKEKHSWPQAEAMIGFFNAWQITANSKYLDRSMASWNFVQQFMRDKSCGEWYWGVRENYTPMEEEDKVGIWKCPYHNSRACIEIIKRIKQLN
ncbi:MAG TPA: AGE family epimerase/isomerase [Flavisolibacter sp.]|nr:AGE family epimerase/isomerase [Flavisolibacter sp.]